MRSFEFSTSIDRPVDVVFDYTSSPENDPTWASGVLESEVVSGGPMRVGATTREVSKFLGKRMESTAEVVEYEPNAKLGVKSTSGPVQYSIRYTYESDNGGTKFTVGGEADTGGFFKLAEGIIMRMLSKEMEDRLDKLKEVLEAEA